jgi:hypothetical protein
LDEEAKRAFEAAHFLDMLALIDELEQPAGRLTAVRSLGLYRRRSHDWS